MTFLTIPFFVFFVLTLTFLSIVKEHRYRQIILLAASYFFYAYWDVRFLLLLIFQCVVAFAGAKMIHMAPETTSTIISKSIVKHGGVANYRGRVYIGPLAHNSKSHVECDTLILDDYSSSDTIPSNEINNNTSFLEHEATVSKINEEQLFYLMSRGLSEKDATQMIVMGFIEPFSKELPMEYAVELNRLIKMDMEGSIG